MRNSTSERKVIGDQTVSVSHFVPGLRESFLAPAVDVVCLDYDGMLGERRIAEPILFTAKGEYVAFNVARDAKQEFSWLCIALLERRFPCWSAAEGAQGRFLWDLASNSLIHTHRLTVLPTEIAEGIAPTIGGCEGLQDSDIPF